MAATRQRCVLGNRTGESDYLLYPGAGLRLIVPCKAGSGKSTLMKFAAHHLQTMHYLQTWAAPSELYTAEHYFWAAGERMQKSMQGLLQNLLHQLFRSLPGLIDILCPDRSFDHTWDLDELRAAFNTLSNQTRLGAKFCFFIDGHDEYNDGRPECEGEFETVVKMVNTLAASGHVKICASSRPWPAFQDEWEASKYVLEVHRLTKEDIDKYISVMLAENGKFSQLANSDERYLHLIQEISHRAKGVWLWVYLVVRDLLRDLRDNEPYKQLLVRLDSYPKELQLYYEDIYGRVERSEPTLSAQIFLLALEVEVPLSLLVLEHPSTPEDPNVAGRALKDPVSLVTSEYMRTRYANWERKLTNTCRDLVKISRKTERGTITHDDSSMDFSSVQPWNRLLDPSSQYAVEFIHRTARDFLAKKSAEKCFPAPKEFYARKFMAYFKYVQIRRYDPVVGSQPLFNHVVDLFLCVDHMRQQIGSTLELPDQLLLLDELEQTLSHLQNKFGPGKFHTDWILIAAAGFKFTPYLEYKLKQDQFRMMNLSTLLLGLALSVREAKEELYQLYGLRYAMITECPADDWQCVGLLLVLSANPNQPFAVTKVTEEPPKSPWKAYVECATRSYSLLPDQRLREDVFDFFRVLPKHGANPDITVQPQGEMAMPLLDYLVTHLDHAEYDELRGYHRSPEERNSHGSLRAGMDR